MELTSLARPKASTVQARPGRFLHRAIPTLVLKERILMPLCDNPSAIGDEAFLARPDSVGAVNPGPPLLPNLDSYQNRR